MPINFPSLDQPRGCDTSPKYVSLNSKTRRDYNGLCYSLPWYSLTSQYAVPGTLASYALTTDYQYGCPRQQTVVPKKECGY